MSRVEGAVCGLCGAGAAVDGARGVVAGVAAGCVAISARGRAWLAPGVIAAWAPCRERVFAGASWRAGLAWECLEALECGGEFPGPGP